MRFARPLPFRIALAVQAGGLVSLPVGSRHAGGGSGMLATMSLCGAWWRAFFLLLCAPSAPVLVWQQVSLLLVVSSLFWKKERKTNKHKHKQTSSSPKRPNWLLRNSGPESCRKAPRRADPAELNGDVQKVDLNGGSQRLVVRRSPLVVCDGVQAGTLCVWNTRSAERTPRAGSCTR